MNYTDYTQNISILAAQASAANGYTLPTDFLNEIPWVIQYAEGRIYREFTFLAARAQDASLTFSGNTRTLSLQNATTIIIVPEGLAAIEPVGAIPALGTRVPFDVASLDVIDQVWPQESQTAQPSSVNPRSRLWAMRDQQTIVVSPTPDAPYSAEITGLFQPAPLSAQNPTTYLLTTYPELYEAASMIRVCAYLRNFGAMADTPQMAMTWETLYKTLGGGIAGEEQRRRAQGTGWSPNLPTPLATPPRT